MITIVKSTLKSIFLLYLFILPIQVLHAQQETTISTPQLSFQHDTLTISYDFQQCSPRNLFNVWIEASTMDGVKLPARSVTGDVGDRIPCGSGKTIYWDLAADSLFINDIVTVQVKATPLDRKAIRGAAHPNYFLSSLAFPGSGLSLLKKDKKPYWIMGIVGYAGMATTVHFYLTSRQQYDDYKQATDEAVKQQLYDGYQNKKKIMEISAITTGTIWLTNLIWTMAVPRNKPMHVALGKNDVNIGLVTFPVQGGSGISLKYTF